MQFSAIFSQKYTGELLTRASMGFSAIRACCLCGLHPRMITIVSPPAVSHLLSYLSADMRAVLSHLDSGAQQAPRSDRQRGGCLHAGEGCCVPAYTCGLWPRTPGLRARTSFSIQKDCGVSDRLDKSETKPGPDSASFTPTPALSVQCLLCPG